LSSQSISKDDLTVGMMPSLIRLTERIKKTIQSLPSIKQYELSHVTVHAAGSAMAIPGLSQAIAGQIGYPVEVYPSKYHPSIDGTKVVLKELNFLRKAAVKRN